MSIMSFSQFVTACITLIFAKSGATCAKSQEQFLAEHGYRFELLFSDFFKFIRGQTMALYRENKFWKKYYATQETLYDRMYDNFLVFVDFALKHITVLDIETLYSGMATQLKKFQEGHYFACCEHADYDYMDYGNSFSSRSFTFSEMAFSSDECDYWRKHYQEQCEFWYEYEPESIYLKNEATDLKNLNANNRLQKVQGHRQDYEKYIFNKGLNKKKRERGHFPLKSHKNKRYL